MCGDITSRTVFREEVEYGQYQDGILVSVSNALRNIREDVIYT